MAVAPALRPFDGATIPQILKDQPRWAPWIAVWNEKRGKHDKIPRRADVPEYGLSTAAPERWFTYAAALATFERETPSLAGVGYVMTRAHGIVGIDLDDCIHDGQLDDWAQTVVNELASYTEVSPSGNGLRIICQGAVPRDWTNHDVGIEVYGGNEPRFLTITGSHLVGSALAVRAPADGVFEGLRAQYGRNAVAAEAVPMVDLPELLDDMLLPSLASLDLPYTARDFLESGESRGDRSRDLHSAAVALYQCGLADDEVFSLLAASPHAMEVALDHRRQDSDRALVYLWKEHCLKAKSKGERKVASAEDFDDVSPADADKVVNAGPVPADKVVKGPRFRVQPVAEFLQRTPASWIVKGVVPQAGLAVVFGESGSGKTFFVLDLIAAVARGTPWRGRKVTQGRVVYICAEGEAGFRNRLQAYCEFTGSTDLPIGVVPDAPNILEKGDVRDLVAAVKAFGPTSIVVMDTFAQVMPGANENSGEDVGRALAHCRALHRATGALVVLVHHAGKDSSKGARGWSGLRAAADAEIEISRSDNARTATVTKLKDGEDGAEFGFRLDPVEIGHDEDGDVISSCVVSHGAVERKKAAPKGDKQKLVLRIAEDLLAMDADITVNQLVEHAVGQLLFDPAVDKRDRRRQHVLQALESLNANGQLLTDGGIVSLP